MYVHSANGERIILISVCVKCCREKLSLKKRGAFMKKILLVVLVVITILSTCSLSHAETESTPISINRLFSNYGESYTIAQKLRYRMNCYGYALQVLTGSSLNPYKQQPGEFADDGETFATLVSELDQYLDSNTYTGSTSLLMFTRKIMSDFETLSSTYGSEWTIQGTTANASVPSGYRKIALTIGLDFDFHFYMRHSDGTWSHKMGANLPTNKSINSDVNINDSNIASVISEGGYDDGAVYFLVKKSAITDYAHQNGHASTCVKTVASFKDRAGDIIKKAKKINGSSRTARFDYEGDVDYFYFTPTTSGNYTFTTSLSSSAYDANMVIYDTYGNLIAIDTSVGNPSITIALTADNRYFVKVYEQGQSVVSYTLYYSH